MKRIETIRNVASLFSGFVLTKSEMNLHYMTVGLKLLREGQYINRTVMLEKTGFDCWDWFFLEWNDCLKSVENGFYRGYE